MYLTNRSKLPEKIHSNFGNVDATPTGVLVVEAEFDLSRHQSNCRLCILGNCLLKLGKEFKSSGAI
jgi:hypothetical protein